MGAVGFIDWLDAFVSSLMQVLLEPSLQGAYPGRWARSPVLPRAEIGTSLERNPGASTRENVSIISSDPLPPWEVTTSHIPLAATTKPQPIATNLGLPNKIASGFQFQHKHFIDADGWDTSRN